MNGLVIPPVPPGELPIYIDSSTLQTWRACKRKWFWSTYEALYPTGASVHLIAGAAIASGLEGIRQFVYTHPEPESLSIQQMLEAGVPGFLREWGSYVPPDNTAKTKENCWRALEQYLVEYDPRTDPVQPYKRPDGTPAVEYRFAVPLNVLHPSGQPFLFVGRFDLLGMFNQLPVICDEKTTSAFSKDWADQWALRGQFIGYTWACQQQGIPVRHALVRGIALQKREIKFQQALIEIPDFQVRRWQNQLELDLRYIVHHYESLKKGPLHVDQPTEQDLIDHKDILYPFNFGDSCNSYGGCAFFGLCTASEPEAWFSNYVRHRWNPLDKQPVKEGDAA